MKKRILAIVGLVLLLVPLLVMSVSAASFDGEMTGSYGFSYAKSMSHELTNPSLFISSDTLSYKALYAMGERAKAGYEVFYDEWENVVLPTADAFVPSGTTVDFSYNAGFLNIGKTTRVSNLVGRAYWVLSYRVTNGEEVSEVVYYYGYGDISYDKKAYSSTAQSFLRLENTLGGADGFVTVDDNGKEIESVEFRYDRVSTSGTAESDYAEQWVLESIRIDYDGTSYVSYADSNIEVGIAFAFTSDVFYYSNDSYFNAFCGSRRDLSTGEMISISRDMVMYAYNGGYEDGSEDGMEYGYNFGYASGQNDGYNSGYNEGYSTGISDGYATGFDEGRFYGYDEGYTVGYYEGREAGYNEGQDDGYTLGFEEGRNEGAEIGMHQGYTTGYSEGYEEGNAEGYDEGYADGLDEGYIEGAQYSTDFGDMVVAILESPMTLIDGMLNFEIFGINLASFVKVILTLAITAAIVFFVLKLTRG